MPNIALVGFWFAQGGKPCVCYTAAHPGSGCDPCAARHPRSFLPPGRNLNAALEAISRPRQAV
jgi:hypothetical protein